MLKFWGFFVLFWVFFLKTRGASVSVSVAKGRLGKMWAGCWRWQGPWWHRTWKRRKYWMPPSPHSLQVRAAFSNPRAWRRKVWSKEHITLGGRRSGYRILMQTGQCESTGPNAVRLKVLRKPADVTAMPLLIVFEWSWWLGEVHEDWGKANVTHLQK